MTIITFINHLIGLFLDTLRQLGRWRIWLMLLIYTLILFGVLSAHANALSPFLYSLMKVWTSLVDSKGYSRFFHYPGHYLYLAQYYGWAKLTLGVMLEGLFLGTIALLFRHHFTAGRPALGDSFQSALKLWGQFVGASVIVNAFITATGIAIPQLLSSYLLGYERRLLAFQLVVMPCIFSVILGLFYSVIPLIAVQKLSFLKALKRSLQMFGSRPFMYFVLSAVVLVFPVITGFLADRADTIVTRFRPELMLWILTVGLVGDMISNFLWMGTATRLLVDERA